MTGSRRHSLALRNRDPPEIPGGDAGLGLFRCLGIEGRQLLLHVLATALGALVAMTVMLLEALGDIETLTAFRALEHRL